MRRRRTQRKEFFVKKKEVEIARIEVIAENEKSREATAKREKVEVEVAKTRVRGEIAEAENETEIEKAKEAERKGEGGAATATVAATRRQRERSGRKIERRRPRNVLTSLPTVACSFLSTPTLRLSVLVVVAKATRT